MGVLRRNSLRIITLEQKYSLTRQRGWAFGYPFGFGLGISDFRVFRYRGVELVRRYITTFINASMISHSLYLALSLFPSNESPPIKRMLYLMWKGKNKYYKTKVTINVWKPKIHQQYEFTFSQIWLLSDLFRKYLNSIEAECRENLANMKVSSGFERSHVKKYLPLWLSNKNLSIITEGRYDSFLNPGVEGAVRLIVPSPSLQHLVLTIFS
ncbi:LOW QUALITY PROTEIN: hypothetical protein YC2023_053415 [Brassica napus]